MADTESHEAEAPQDERAYRRSRRQALIDGGINPYPIASCVDAYAADLEACYAELGDGEHTADTVNVAGRVRALRKQGKVVFIVVEDKSGSIQLFCRVNELDEASWELISSLDRGDILGASGVIMRTRRGQLSVLCSSLKLLSKSLRPLPEKFHGLSDKELRYRQRYVDLIMNPEVKSVFIKRSQIITCIRRYMDAHGYMEVETPILHDILGGANAKPFSTHYNALGIDCYLRIATELPLKRLIVGGLERVYEIGRQFRNEGMDLTHNPEFTTMEAYCAYSDLAGMKALSQGLFQCVAREVLGCAKGEERLSYQGVEVDLSGEWRSASMAEIVSEVLGESLSIDTPLEHLRELCAEHGIEVSGAWGAGKLLFELYDELGEKTIIAPTFVCDYPAEVSPLAKRKEDDPRLTDRFELVICANEYANAFSELNDPVDQEDRFAAQMEAKRQGDEEAMEYDTDYIRALEFGMPPTGGVGYGIDRMVMLFCDQASIRDVLLFPQMRPEEGRAPKGGGIAQDTKAACVPEIAAASVQEPAVTPEAAGAPAQEPAQAPAAASLDPGLSREEAFALLSAYNEDPFHILHARTLEALLGYYARSYDPKNEEFWRRVGLLHDLDWEKFPDTVQHTVKAGELIRAAGGSEALIHSIQTHNCFHNPDLPRPEHKMECVLYAVDELSGLIQASVLMLPSKSVQDLKLKSLKKKFKSKGFAAGCSRDVIRDGAELCGMDLDELLDSALEAMKAIDAELYGSPDA